MMTIKCSICSCENDMRELTSPWFEDGENDICPDCFEDFKDRNESLIDEYKAKKEELFKVLRVEHTQSNVLTLVQTEKTDDS